MGIYLRSLLKTEFLISLKHNIPAETQTAVIAETVTYMVFLLLKQMAADLLKFFSRLLLAFKIWFSLNYTSLNCTSLSG